MRILVAEDELLTRMILRDRLLDWGHEVVVTADGAKALEALQSSDISLVITDWLMPEMDGIELCRRVRAATWDRYIYLLLLTAMDRKEDMAKAFEAGADDYATKPLDEPELQSRLHAAVRVIELERELSRRVAALEESLRTIRQLKELLPICMYCKKIRSDGDYWQQLEEYIHESTGSDFSHGICPDCFESVVKPQLEQLKRELSAPTSGQSG